MTTITEALRAARACIQQDRTSLADTGMRHDNTMEPDAAAGVAEYDAVLQQIDAALAGITHHITDEQIDATSADELLLKVYELLWGEHPECCGNPEAVGYFGDSPAIDCCRRPNYARLNDAQIVASLRALIKESDLMSLLGMRAAKTTPLADWSVDVFDDDEEGRTYINIRNPDDDVAAAGVNTYVVGNRRTLASQVLRGFHQAFRAALTAAPTPPAQTTPEPVGGPWGWAIEDKHGVAQAIRPARKEFFGCVQSTEPFTAEDIAKMDREWVGIAPHRIVTLHTRPVATPAVPESADTPTAQDAEHAGLVSVNGHLSTLLNESTQMLAQLRAMVDALHDEWSNGGRPERGEFSLLDRVDDWLNARPSEMLEPQHATPEQPAVPEDVARVNKQMLEALEEALPALPTWHRPKVSAAIDAARAAEKGGA